MILSIVAVLAGLALLVWSADRFVEGASATASNLGLPTLIIGITVVGFGTSAPEILISVFSVIDNTPDLAIGNAMGSNIANIGLILGTTALIIPIVYQSRLLKHEFPLLIFASAVLSWFLWDLQLKIIEGLVLIILLFAALTYLIVISRKSADERLEAELDLEIPHDLTTGKALGLTLIGLILLVGSAKILVWGAVNIAVSLGISELVIGLTIVALGTSLPELAAAIAAAKKNEPELVMGNVVGSNLFNTLAVIGIPAAMTNFTISAAAVQRDLPVMLTLTAALFVMSLWPKSSFCQITRSKGALLLAAFVLYQGLLYYQTAS